MKLQIWPVILDWCSRLSGALCRFSFFHFSIFSFLEIGGLSVAEPSGPLMAIKHKGKRHRVQAEAFLVVHLNLEPKKFTHGSNNSCLVPSTLSEGRSRHYDYLRRRLI